MSQTATRTRENVMDIITQPRAKALGYLFFSIIQCSKLVPQRKRGIKIQNLFYILICIFGLSYSSNAQFAILKTDADSLVLLGTSQIYNLEFDKATLTFQEVIRLYPEHPAGYFLEAMVEWWKVFLHQNSRQYDDGFLAKIKNVLDVCEKDLSEDPSDINALFFKGGTHGYRAKFYADRKDWINAVSDAKVAYEILKKCQEIAPNNHDIMLGTGLYNYFTVALQEQYPIVTPLMAFLPKGDKTIGLLQLQAASRYARYASIEAKVMLLQVYFHFEKDYSKALEVAQELYSRYPNNPYFHRYLARSYNQNGYYAEMENEFREILKRYIAKKPGYEIYSAREALYYIGWILMNRRDYDKALEYFYKCDEACRKIDKEPSGFMVKLNLNIGYIYDMQKKREYARKQYEKVLRMKEYQNSHEMAEKYLDKPYGN